MKTDVLIIGAGLAGLYAALALDRSIDCVIAAKEEITVSNSYMAQGGIAAAMLPEDSPADHLGDTLVSGSGLCDSPAADILTREAPGDIENLRRLGVPFDLTADGNLHISREGGHRRRRIVHAGGDATGREAVKVLAETAAARPNIKILPRMFMCDLCLSGGVCQGAVFLDAAGAPVTVSAGVVILASGGAGRVYRRTTNPDVATGDGIAAAARAGARILDMEFVQFHPTGIYLPDRGGRAFLISEALRGEGGILVNHSGERFCDEMQPRDIVARNIAAELKSSGKPNVWLDSPNKSVDSLAARFPTIAAECAREGIDIRHIPVSPAQHYIMGGVSVNARAETNIPRLFAVGETARTGVHGANRLASNSMLECLVFGRRAAEQVNSEQLIINNCGDACLARKFPESADLVRDICQKFAWLTRTSEGLKTGLDMLENIPLVETPVSRAAYEALNMLAAAKEIFTAAINRGESVGAHYVI